MRICCAVEYDGSRYCGWQRQDHANSVQAEVESALARVADHPVSVFCAGRTDAGVHATCQIIHFDSEAERSERAWVLGSNTHLPADIRLSWACPIDETFHARFSATERSYRYVILNRPVASALLYTRVTWEYRTLDAARMQTGAEYLLGEHDFSTFRAVACQAKSPVRTIHAISVVRSGDFLYIDVTANAFLHHMVRNISGVLMTIGRGEQAPGWVADILAERDRTRGGVTAPAAGLYLVGVGYASAFSIDSGNRRPIYG